MARRPTCGAGPESGRESAPLLIPGNAMNCGLACDQATPGARPSRTAPTMASTMAIRGIDILPCFLLLSMEVTKVTPARARRHGDHRGSRDHLANPVASDIVRAGSRGDGGAL